ncbi:MAG TPA: anaerobic sulfatase maturase [Candidatus Coprenecus stercoravium]|uniref:Anaerobic sulfatase maturase n=1 Tax=Candidatus Coprenecus stercoravium TaxID=2840735 RepID=A0A9D2GQ39_9BACT|nr:anaerobic sulfatase maturase [Candidatus Coprenecus stercoravium]
MGGVGGTITFQEAVRFGHSPAFSLMIKPVGDICNMRCAYCYYTGRSSAVAGGKSGVMEPSLLEECLRNFFSSCDLPELTVEWHGGEPLLAGLDFFKEAVSMERRLSGGRKVHNTLQTNGTLLDGEWASFFRDEDFLLGLSLDGPEDIHDSYRRCAGGRPSFGSVMRGMETLLRAGVEFNTLTTVNRTSEGRGEEVYRFLKSAGSRYMQFMPVMEHLPDGSVAPYSVSPEGFGRYMCDIYDCWSQGDAGEYYVLTFDAALACRYGIEPGICAFRSSCGGNLVVERDGGIYPCDHYVRPGYSLGNVRISSLRDAAASPEQMRFGLAKRSALSPRCLSCTWRFACNGGCPRHRNSDGLNALCEGYKMLYSHISSLFDVKDL